ASRFAYHLMQEIVPLVDYVIDFHAGGRSRFNVPQIRIEPGNLELERVAQAFLAPFLLHSENIEGSFREACDHAGVRYLLFEGGKALDIHDEVIEEGVQGTMRFLDSLNMLHTNFHSQLPVNPTVLIESSFWIRTQSSGLLHHAIPNGSFVNEGEILGMITDPYGTIEDPILAPNSGYIICQNQAAIVFQGDAVYHISTKLKDD
ncbi:MAG TPA: succinylglutamate desuccinylase/aspartoacylase family protein, partial [Flavobacterium sp.]|nr:succinylglutamate desuccinylase/aspartoacylase family protein [Flavobacterium sp.]